MTQPDTDSYQTMLATVQAFHDKHKFQDTGGEDLTYRYTTEERGIPIRRYWINGCKTCPLRSNCTTGNERRISRWEREDLVDEIKRSLTVPLETDIGA